MAETRDDVQDASGQRTNMPGLGVMRGWGIGPQYQVTANTINNIAGNPINGEAGWGIGAQFTNPLSGVIGNILFINRGTQASATWINLV